MTPFVTCWCGICWQGFSEGLPRTEKTANSEDAVGHQRVFEMLTASTTHLWRGSSKEPQGWRMWSSTTKSTESRRCSPVSYESLLIVLDANDVLSMECIASITDTRGLTDGATLDYKRVLFQIPFLMFHEASLGYLTDMFRFVLIFDPHNLFYWVRISIRLFNDTFWEFLSPTYRFDSSTEPREVPSRKAKIYSIIYSTQTKAWVALIVFKSSIHHWLTVV